MAEDDPSPLPVPGLPAEDDPVEIEIVYDDDRWLEIEPPLDGIARRAVAAACEAAGLPGTGYELSILACDDTRIAELNGTHRGKDRPTNVLSWPAHDLAPEAPGELPFLPPEPRPGIPEALGDIAIAYETCQREAAEAEIPAADHLLHLLLHATLHLLGFDHETDADAELMEQIESETLVSMGVADPYSSTDADPAFLTRQEP